MPDVGHPLPGIASRAGLALVLAALVLLAWHNRFVQDDAFISFRYAENLAKGHGLVWNPGERVEGYTNFLWTLSIAGLISVGVPPIAASQFLGMACFVVSLAFTYRLAAAVLRSQRAALLAVVLLGANYSFSAYATGGLETQLQACLYVICFDILFRTTRHTGPATGSLVALSVVLAAALLTRPDSALVVAVVGVAILCHTVRARMARRQAMARLCALAIPFALIVGVWLSWKLRYYGSLLPNTYYAKAAGHTSLESGLNYLHTFALSYWLVPFPFLALVALPRLARDRGLLVLCVFMALWLAYVANVGGGFMEFRFLVPILPFAFIVIAWLLVAFIEQRAVRIALAALVLAGSLHHARTFGRATKTRQIDTFRRLTALLYKSDSNWVGVGRALGRAFGAHPDITIAVTPAGAIPYYSRLRTIDMLGLNDAHIARNTAPVGDRPGHRRMAPLSYLIERNVHLLIGHPWLRPADEAARATYHADRITALWWVRTDDGAQLPGHARILEIPVEPGWRLIAVYLTPSAAVDRVAAQRGWRILPIAPSHAATPPQRG